jgi:hypothetical protein
MLCGLVDVVVKVDVKVLVAAPDVNSHSRCVLAQYC